MRKKMISIFLAILLVSFTCQAIAANADDEQTQDDTELWQMDQLDQQRPQQPPPGAGQYHQRGDRRPGPESCRPGENQQSGCMPGSQGQRMTPPWQRNSQQTNSPEYLEQLQTFLTEHEPSLAELLAELQENEPERYQRSIATIVRHYGPIMEQMEYDPEMAQINLRRTRLTLEVEQALRVVKNANEDQQATSLLNDKVTDLYELILQQQTLELDRVEERFQEMQQRLTSMEEREASSENADENRMSTMPGMRQRDRKSVV